MEVIKEASIKQVGGGGGERGQVRQRLWVELHKHTGQFGGGGQLQRSSFIRASG